MHVSSNYSSAIIRQLRGRSGHSHVGNVLLIQVLHQLAPSLGLAVEFLNEVALAEGVDAANDQNSAVQVDQCNRPNSATGKSFA